jgi:hypothetical protein
MDRTIAGAKENGYVETLSPAAAATCATSIQPTTVRSAAERTAINTPIQGTAADMIKLAMVRVAAALKDQALRSRMVLQVHDELRLRAFSPVVGGKFARPFPDPAAFISDSNATGIPPLSGKNDGWPIKKGCWRHPSH